MAIYKDTDKTFYAYLRHDSSPYYQNKYGQKT